LKDYKFELSIGVGVNLSSHPEGSTMLDNIPRDDLLRALADRLLKNIRVAEEEGVEAMLARIKF
jgi:hypothetical protein